MPAGYQDLPSLFKNFDDSCRTNTFFSHGDKKTVHNRVNTYHNLIVGNIYDFFLRCFEEFDNSSVRNAQDLLLSKFRSNGGGGGSSKYSI
jgi:hypothetical protein